jgi:anhydro-N-acetylmuramic acid kinase
MFKEKYKVIELCLELRLTELIWHTLILPYKIINGIWNLTLKPYPTHWLVKQIENSSISQECSSRKTEQDYTQYLGSIISNFIKKHNIKNLDAVCSHGHTVLQSKVLPCKLVTWQISTEIDQTVVCDFRVQDVQLGGQGAPLNLLVIKCYFHNTTIVWI